MGKTTTREARNLVDLWQRHGCDAVVVYADRICAYDERSVPPMTAYYPLSGGRALQAVVRGIGKHAADPFRYLQGGQGLGRTTVRADAIDLGPYRAIVECREWQVL